MCRNIRPLFNFDPPATDEEILAAAEQFVRKVSGYNKPSKSNQEAFDSAIAEITACARRLIDELTTDAPPKNRQQEAEKRRARSLQRFGKDARATPRKASSKAATRS